MSNSLVRFGPVVVESTTGGSHVRIPRVGESVYERKTLCGLSCLGWAELYDLDEFPRPHLWDIRSQVSCSRCARAWERQQL